MTNPERDTSLGGGGRDFPTTQWSQFLAHGSSLDFLMQTYWKPVYCYARIKWARTNDEAKDITQDFFVWVMGSEFLSKVDRERGRFRAFLRVSLDNYIVSRDRRDNAVKRGGGRPILELDRDRDGIPKIDVPDPLGRTPEQVMDDAWKQEILQMGMERLEKRLAEEGKQAEYSIFKDFCEPRAEKIALKDLGAKYGMDADQVARCIRTVRKRCRTIFSDIVAETVQSHEDLESEMKWFFGEAGP